MSTLLYAAADTVPLWRVPLIAVLFLVVVIAFHLIGSALDDD